MYSTWVCRVFVGAGLGDWLGDGEELGEGEGDELGEGDRDGDWLGDGEGDEVGVVSVGPDAGNRYTASNTATTITTTTARAATVLLIPFNIYTPNPLLCPPTMRST